MKQEHRWEQEVYEFIALAIIPKYPTVTVFTDPLKDMIKGKDAARLMALAKKRGLGKGNPDLCLAVAVGGYCGIALELKNSYSDIFTKNGLLKKKTIDKKNRYGNVIESYDHNLEQARKLENLRLNGWYADYGFGFDDTIAKLRKYFNV